MIRKYHINDVSIITSLWLLKSVTEVLGVLDWGGDSAGRSPLLRVLNNRAHNDFVMRQEEL
jgi:hypothetical protein